MTLTEQLFGALVLVSFAGFAAFVAFLSLSEHLYERRQKSSAAAKGYGVLSHHGAKAA